MAKKNTFKKKEAGKEPSQSKITKKTIKKPFRLSQRFYSILGLLLLLIGIYLLLAFFSYLFTWQTDQDAVFKTTANYFSNPEIYAQNILGKFGAFISHNFFYNGVGISSFIISFLFIVTGINTLSIKRKLPIASIFGYSLLAIIMLSLISSFLFFKSDFPWGGAFGTYSNKWLQSLIGKIGTGLLYFFALAGFVLLFFNDQILQYRKRSVENDEFIDIKQATNTNELKDDVENEDSEEEQSEVEEKQNRFTKNNSETTEKKVVHTLSSDSSSETVEEEDDDEFEIIQKEEKIATKEEELDDLNLELEEIKEEKKATHYGIDSDFDPTLELGDFRLPNLTLLDDHGEENIEIDRDELEANKDQIVQTLKNYKIEISKIKATVGPTVTLYEIVPAPGIRISKIKNLEDDIALSLAALGIRIIAPIPGKGTIGIEVPNQHPNVVSMKSMLASEKFVNSKADLPVAIGKTISNENYIADLAKMPHLLIAGATGQGKSVGINALIVSLLYHKHPSELKFVFIDPKKVELSIYNKIENHYLAKLPDEDEAIITDTAKVVNTLNSLCIEMDERYELLKNAHCRNIKEYNQKFKNRRLNPENGHKYLPYIVLVIDEFADLIMTAGKEVESPIARLAQLARAVGIHLIIATQRPSVNIITGIIKANFPARIAFRVMSKVDSRTILDMGGADQLIGRGDLILSIGSDSIRLQCPFVDTPEVDKITSFIGQQKSYGHAHLLPEYSAESSGTLDDDEDLDEYFADAARLVVQSDSGSTSMLQRKFSIGYNRAGRIMDQLERAGIVGAQNGSKPREVLYTSEIELEQFLENLGI